MTEKKTLLACVFMICFGLCGCASSQSYVLKELPEFGPPIPDSGHSSGWNRPSIELRVRLHEGKEWKPDSIEQAADELVSMLPSHFFEKVTRWRMTRDGSNKEGEQLGPTAEEWQIEFDLTAYLQYHWMTDGFQGDLDCLEDFPAMANFYFYSSVRASKNKGYNVSADDFQAYKDIESKLAECRKSVGN
jgi:hypothetical protein